MLHQHATAEREQKQTLMKNQTHTTHTTPRPQERSPHTVTPVPEQKTTLRDASTVDQDETIDED